jgi:CheY-like chemotaxis protein
MAEDRKVLIVDDDKIWQMFISAALQDDYKVISAFDGDIGLKLAAEWLPDTILLDLELPLKNGYEVCKELKANPLLRDIPVIFLSGKSSLQEKIAGFQLGADDYLVKPCEAAYLNAKVARSTALYCEKKEAKAKASDAEIMAFEAMNSSADLGRSLRFAERTYAMYSFDKLAEGLFQTMAEFGLDTSVMFITQAGPLFYAQNKYELSPLERDMFLTIHKEGRFCDFGNRTFCNFTLVSLLIKNMPLSDPERYGRIKDTVPWILGVTDGRIGALDVSNLMVATHQKVLDTVSSLESILNKSLDEVRLLDARLAESSTGIQTVQLNQGLVSALSLLSDLAKEQRSVGELAENDETRKQHMGLGADEIFSSDVDFF